MKVVHFICFSTKSLHFLKIFRYHIKSYYATIIAFQVLVFKNQFYLFIFAFAAWAFLSFWCAGFLFHDCSCGHRLWSAWTLVVVEHGLSGCTA